MTVPYRFQWRKGAAVSNQRLRKPRKVSLVVGRKLFFAATRASKNQSIGEHYRFLLYLSKILDTVVTFELVKEKLCRFSAYLFYGLLNYADGRMQRCSQFKIIEAQQSKT